MKIAGKQIPWWAVVAVGVVVVGVAVALAMGTGTPDDKKSTRLPDGSAESPQSAPATATPAGSTNQAKNTATQTAGSPGDSGNDSKPADSDSKAQPGSSLGDSGNGSKPSVGSGGGDVGPTADKGYVVVKYWNDTQSKQAGDIEIVVGLNVWKPSADQKSDTRKLGPIALDETLEFVVYPDGRDGKKIVVPVTVTAGMSGMDTDAIHVELRDDQVRVLGNPVANFQVLEARS